MIITSFIEGGIPTVTPQDVLNLKDATLIAEADSRIPAEYDPAYIFNESSIDARLEFYKQLSDDDFFEIVARGNEVIAFHIVKKTPYPPNIQIGNIVTSWVRPGRRNQNWSLCKLMCM